MPRSALFLALVSATLVLPMVASASCGKTRAAGSCQDGMTWSAADGRCVPKVGS